MLSKRKNIYFGREVLDVRRDNFLSLLTGLSAALSSDDITVLYFSGHATHDNDKLNLVFSDERNGLLLPLPE